MKKEGPKWSKNQLSEGEMVKEHEHLFEIFRKSKGGERVDGYPRSSSHPGRLPNLG